MYDVIILGTGPAGYTAALYTSRAYLKTLILTGPQDGGQLTTTTEVDNYPGFPKGIQGPQLMEDMKAQVVRFGTEIKLETVISLQSLASLPASRQGGRGRSGSDLRQQFKRFVVETAEKNKYETKAIIVATGASAKYLGLQSEQRLMGKGVSACATCDGFFFKGKEVVVVGGGDTAMEEATFLTKFATKVTIIHRRDQFRASAIMLARAQKNPKISFLTNKIVEVVLGDSSVSGVKLKDAKTGEASEYPTQGFFLAIGHQPNTGFLKGIVSLDEKGYVLLEQGDEGNQGNSGNKVNPMLAPQSRTSVEGIFAAGDCVDPRYRQAVVAAGMGCMAAMDAEKWLEEKS